MPGCFSSAIFLHGKEKINFSFGPGDCLDFFIVPYNRNIIMRGRAFILYKTDNWHNQDAKTVLGVFTSKENTILNAIRHAKREGEVISSDDQYLLDTIAQTQSYEGEGEYIYEEIILNELMP